MSDKAAELAAKVDDERHLIALAVGQLITSRSRLRQLRAGGAVVQGDAPRLSLFEVEACLREEEVLRDAPRHVRRPSSGGRLRGRGASGR